MKEEDIEVLGKNAKDVFKKGDKVVLSVHGHKLFYERNQWQRRQIGTVVGFSRRHPHCVIVQWNGLKQPETLAFWFIELSGVENE